MTLEIWNISTGLNIANKIAADLVYSVAYFNSLKIDINFILSLPGHPDYKEKLDAFSMRFGKLQDMLGDQIFRALLAIEKEDVQGMTMRTKLNLMEKMGIIDSAEQWEELRKIRNGLTHDYEENPEQAAAFLNIAVGRALELNAILSAVERHIEAIGLRTPGKQSQQHAKK